MDRFQKGIVVLLIGDGCAIRPGYWFALHENLALTACPGNPEFHDAPEAIFL